MRLVDTYPALEHLLSRAEGAIAWAWDRQDDFLAMAAERALVGRGKRLRPSILLLAAECAGGATETSIVLAGVAELVHAASLVHDDVVDEAASRRGRRSANAMWGNKVSVLLGDYLIATALDLLPTGERERFLPALADVALRMCSGQVAELRAAGRSLAESEYVDIARAKTGSLLSFCGRAGAETAGGEPGVAQALAEFGEKFGIAFQFADDILDLVGTDGQSGKPEGRDLAERKFTLPLIVATEIGGRAISGKLEAILAQVDISDDDVRLVRELVESAGAVQVSWERVRAWLAAARADLDSIPDSEAKAALECACGELFPMPVMAAER